MILQGHIKEKLTIIINNDKSSDKFCWIGLSCLIYVILIEYVYWLPFFTWKLFPNISGNILKCILNILNNIFNNILNNILNLKYVGAVLIFGSQRSKWELHVCIFRGNIKKFKRGRIYQIIVGPRSLRLKIEISEI